MSEVAAVPPEAHTREPHQDNPLCGRTSKRGGWTTVGSLRPVRCSECQAALQSKITR